MTELETTLRAIHDGTDADAGNCCKHQCSFMESLRAAAAAGANVERDQIHLESTLEAERDTMPRAKYGLMVDLAAAQAEVKELVNANNDLCMERDSARYDLGETLEEIEAFHKKTGFTLAEAIKSDEAMSNKVVALQTEIEALRALLVEVSTQYRNLVPLVELDRDLLAMVDAAVSP